MRVPGKNQSRQAKPSVNEIEARFQLAQRVIVEAASTAQNYFLNHHLLQRQVKSSPQDFVTLADKELELYISENIWQSFPEDIIYGEEHGWQSAAPNSLSTQKYWLIDPIDGTANFARGIAGYCISIAFIKSGEAQFGVIYDPILQELHTGIGGKGAWCNNEPVRAADLPWEQSLVSLGRSARHESQAHWGVIPELLDSGAEYRRFGSAALSLAHVAAGRLSAYYEPLVHPWDVAAGLVICREAGARLSVYQLPECRSEPMAAPLLVAQPNIFDRLQEIPTIQKFFHKFKNLEKRDL